MHSNARFRANSPKGGDAKPPVYGTHVPMTAGLPVGFQTVPRMALGRADPKARLQNAWVRHTHFYQLSLGLSSGGKAFCVPHRGPLRPAGANSHGPGNGS